MAEPPIFRHFRAPPLPFIFQSIMSSAEEQALPTYEDVVSAYELIKGTVKRTPVHTSETFDALSGRQLFFKCELFQKGGAFKYRGATNACMRLPEASPPSSRTHPATTRRR